MKITKEKKDDLLFAIKGQINFLKTMRKEVERMGVGGNYAYNDFAIAYWKPTRNWWEQCVVGAYRRFIKSDSPLGPIDDNNDNELNIDRDWQRIEKAAVDQDRRR